VAGTGAAAGEQDDLDAELPGGDDLVEDREHGRAAAVEDALAADLDDLDVGHQPRWACTRTTRASRSSTIRRGWTRAVRRSATGILLDDHGADVLAAERARELPRHEAVDDHDALEVLGGPPGVEQLLVENVVLGGTASFSSASVILPNFFASLCFFGSLS